MKIYGYEQFIPGRTNICTIVNLHYYNLYNLPIASEEAKIPISRSQTIQFTIISIIVEILTTKHSKGKYKFCFEEYLGLNLSGKPLIHCPVHGKM
jgi:hypothetical protein